VGFGVSQVLPILLGIAAHRDAGDTLFCIEQPELHLHPKMQSRLARVFRNGLYRNLTDETNNESEMRNENTFLIETHSEHLVRGLQLLIAKKRLNQNDVAVYYVEKNPLGSSSIKKMPIDESGFFTEPWPEGFFDQAYLQTLELLAGKN
jgi:predicted ATPase